MDKIAVVEYEYPEIIKSAKTETIKSYSLVPEYCDESFSIQDSLVAGDDQQESELSCVANDELGKTLPDRHKPFAEMSKAAEVTGKYHNLLILFEKFLRFLLVFDSGVTIAKTSKCYLLVDYSSSDESVSLTDASMAANEDSELDLCRVLNDESGKTRPDKTSTLRKDVQGKKKFSLSKEENKVITKLLHLLEYVYINFLIVIWFRRKKDKLQRRKQGKNAYAKKRKRKRKRKKKREKPRRKRKKKKKR
jgi:hypothetical protein